MRKLTICLIVALLTFLLGITAATVWLAKRQSVVSEPQKNVVTVTPEKQGLSLNIPRATWEPIFFESINERASVAKLPNLRTALLPNNDLEVRIWVGFGLTALEGLVLRRVDSQWSATHLEGIHSRLPKSEYQKRLQTPKSGWDASWQRLIDAGILTLPDASEVQCNAGVLDGMSYVIEINMNKTYRTYMYDNPNYAKCNEAKQMIKIGDIRVEEFGVRDFSIKK